MKRSKTGEGKGGRRRGKVGGGKEETRDRWGKQKWHSVMS